MGWRGHRLGVGVVGCGHIAERWHIPSALATPGVELIAAADTDSGRLERVARRFSIPRRHRTVEELVADPDVGAVAVCVPARHHAAVAEPVLRAGKHLLIEKPLALTLPECDRLLAASEAAGCVAMVAFNLRWHRLVRQARARIRRGDLGSVQSIRAAFPCGALHPESVLEWVGSRHLGGGALVETGIHDFDLLRFLLDTEIEEVFAVTLSGQADDEAVAVAGRLRHGIPFSATFVERTAGNHEVEVFGSRGRLVVSCFRFDGLSWFPAGHLEGQIRARLARGANALRELPRALLQRRSGGVWGEAFRAQWAHFVAAARGQVELECSLLDGRRAVEAVLAAAASAATGLPVRVAQAPDTITPVARA